MAISIGSNLASLGAQRRLGEATSIVSKANERLSSGLRINRASDDAASLAIADQLEANSALYNTARRNINDAVSVTNIMDSTLSAQQSILIRLKELAEQSSNGVYAAPQRTALNSEYRALASESARLAQAAAFNGISLLAGKREGNPSGFVIQAGIDGDVSAALTLQSPDTGSLSGEISVSGDFTGDGLLTPSERTTIITTYGSCTSLDDLSVLLHGPLATATVIDSGGTERTVYYGLLQGVAWPHTDVQARHLYVFAEKAQGNGFLLKTSLIEYEDGETPLSETYSLALNFGSKSATLNLDFSALTIKEKTTGPDSSSAIEFTGIETMTRANNALTVITNRQNELNVIRGEIGAIQSRFEQASQVVAALRENSAAACSRIREADIAGESANLIRMQIIQRTASAVLSQANAAPRLALVLMDTSSL